MATTSLMRGPSCSATLKRHRLAEPTIRSARHSERPRARPSGSVILTSFAADPIASIVPDDVSTATLVILVVPRSTPMTMGIQYLPSRSNEDFLVPKLQLGNALPPSSSLANAHGVRYTRIAKQSFEDRRSQAGAWEREILHRLGLLVTTIYGWLALRIAISDRNSNTRFEARMAVIAVGSNGGETSTRSKPIRFNPLSPRTSCNIS